MHSLQASSWLLAIQAASVMAEPIQLDFSVRTPKLVRRGTQPVNLTLTNDNNIQYTAMTGIGTPAQNMTVSLSMSSADFWVNSFNSSICSVQNCNGGTFDASQSNSYRLLANTFEEDFADGNVTGAWITETVTLGQSGIKVNGQQIGLAYVDTQSANDVDGMLGLAYEAATVYGSTYPTIMQQLVDQGRIKSQVYSLYLDTQSSATGSVLFGGIDTTKFTGQLTKLSVLPDPADSQYYQAAIALTGLSYGNTQILTGGSYRMTINPENTFTTLPNAIFAKVVSAMGVTYDPVDDGYPIACSNTASTYSTLNFTFSGTTIVVPPSEYIFPDANGNCWLGLTSSTDPTTYSLGVSLLRNAYVVFSLDHNIVSLAQAKFGVTGSSITEIGISADDPAFTASATSSTPTSPAPTPTPTQTHHTHSGLPTGAIAGIVVAAVLIILLTALGIFLYWRRSRKPSPQEPSEAVAETHHYHPEKMDHKIAPSSPSVAYANAAAAPVYDPHNSITYSPVPRYSSPEPGQQGFYGAVGDAKAPPLSMQSTGVSVPASEYHPHFSGPYGFGGQPGLQQHGIADQSGRVGSPGLSELPAPNH